jgi:hypothetical protein
MRFNYGPPTVGFYPPQVGNPNIPPNLISSPMMGSNMPPPNYGMPGQINPQIGGNRMPPKQTPPQPRNI